MIRKKNKIKCIATINDIPNIVNGFSCVFNFAKRNGKTLFSFLFLLSFFSVNAQVFVGDSTLVSNEGTIVYSTSTETSISTEKLEAFIFVSKGAVFMNADKIANVKIAYENTTKENKISEPKTFAKNTYKNPKSFYKNDFN